VTRIAVVAAALALLLFAALAVRLRQRVGPWAGALLAALLALFLGCSAAFLAVRALDTPAAAPRSLIVLADDAAVRGNPEAVRAALDRVPRGTRVRLAHYNSPAAGSPERSAGVPAGLQPEARFISLDGALGWAALETAGAALPEILVLGEQAALPPEQGRPTLTSVPVPLPARRDRIETLRLPGRVFPGRQVPIRALVRTPAGGFQVRLAVDDALREVRRGEARAEAAAEFAFTIPAGRAGQHRLLVELVGPDGVVVDREYGEYAVRPLPRLAYVGPEGRSPLARQLAAAGYPIEAVGLDQLAAGVSSRTADLVVLEDVAAARLSWPVVSALSRAAAWDGLGLLFVGGPHSFTAGGYRDAPVERLLPVTMGLRDPAQEKHRTALVIVLDTSWSMLCPPEGCAKDAERMWGAPRETRGPRVRKIDLARQALLELLPAMKAVDHFGILGVRTAPYWELEPDVLADPAAVEERVRRITASGSGILLYSALLEASKRLLPLDADIKHLLVLLDTDDIDEIRVLGVGTVEGLVAELARQRVSVSFVGFGFSDDRYVPLLHQLASSTGGSLYLSSDITSIPRFLRQDREGLAGHQTIRRRLSTRHDETALPGLAATPPVDGIFVAEAKEDARTLVWTELGYPLMALRRIERGAVGAFLSDGGAEMAPQWAAPAAGAAWDAALGALLASTPADDSLFLSREGRGAALWWRTSGRSAARPVGRLLDPRGKSEPADFHEVYPGTWRADVANLGPGSHYVEVQDAAATARAFSFGVAAAASLGAPGERPDFGRFAPPPAQEPIDGRVPPLLLLLAAASVLAYGLLRGQD
jgi:uncharacterized membrane protein